MEPLRLQKSQDLRKRTNRRRSLPIPILRRRNQQEVRRLQQRTRLGLHRMAQTNRRMVRQSFGRSRTSHLVQVPKILQTTNSSSNRPIPLSPQRTSQGLGPSPKRQTQPSSRMPLPKMGRAHQTMEIVLRTTALLGQGQMGSLHGLKKRKGHHLHQMPLR